MFTFEKCFDDEGNEFVGLLRVQPKVFADVRGYFLETYSERDFASAGLGAHFVQDNQSRSSRGVLRGLHFQKHFPQGKLVRSLSGKVWDVAVDLRQGSATFGKHYGVLLDSDLQNQFYVPPGFAHGFCVISSVAVFAYKCTDFYHPEDEGGIAWDDPILAIDWGRHLEGSPVLSAKDQGNPHFSRDERYFDMAGVWQGA